MDELGRSLSPRPERFVPSAVALQLATLATLMAYLDDSALVRRGAFWVALFLVCLVVVDSVVWLLRHYLPR